MTTIDDTTASKALVGRLFAAALGTAELFTVYLGQVHGLYRAVDSVGSTTAAELSQASGVELRYLLEWLQSQAISGLLSVDGPDIGTARFSLTPGVRETLLDETNPYYAGGMPAIAVAVGRAFPQLEAAFKTGAGVPYAEYGPEAVTAQAALNRPAYVNSLVAEWLPVMPDVQARMAAGARVADVGTGAGWSAIELAKAYRAVHVDGYDNDEESISRARRNAAEHSVSDRVDFEVRDIDEIAAHGVRYDLITFFECLHDLAHPVAALAAARQALAPGGTVLVMDENVDETLVAPGDEVQRFFAAASVIWCTPQGRVEADSEVIGAVMRPARLRELAAAAGFTTVNILPIEHPFWRFYRLNP
ncbi:MAG: Methyltransferase protein [Frankiales bacterium]|nr:Methyltransferase protein [Frankiales bacterium]